MRITEQVLRSYSEIGTRVLSCIELRAGGQQADDLSRESSLPCRERTRSRFSAKRGRASAGLLGPSPAGGGDWLRGRFLDAPRGLEAADSMAMGARRGAEGGTRRLCDLGFSFSLDDTLAWAGLRRPSSHCMGLEWVNGPCPTDRTRLGSRFFGRCRHATLRAPGKANVELRVPQQGTRGGG